MLIISPEQLARFAAQALQAFRIRLREHLCETFPLQTAIATPQAIDAFVDLAIAEARAAGIRTEATVQSFADHMLLLGVDFQHNPLYATITAPLEDPDLISPIQRMDLVYDRAWAYLDEVRGPDAIHLIHALVRLRSWVATPRPVWSTETASLMQSIAEVFPEKGRAHAPAVLNDFCTTALALAGVHRFEQPPAQVLFVCTAFVVGLGFVRDPMLTGAVPSYTDALDQEESQQRRTDLLGRGVMACLDKTIAMLRTATASSAPGP